MLKRYQSSDSARLLVSLQGDPLAFDIFEGNKFEGRTMLPVVETFKNKFNLEHLLIIAGSSLFSNNIELKLRKNMSSFWAERSECIRQN